MHQFVKIGSGAMIGGMSGVEHNVIPYGTVMGERASLAGLNLIGLKRRNFSREDIHELRNFFKKLFGENNTNFLARTEELEKEFSGNLVAEVVAFIKSDSSRAFCQMKQNN
jgi:UDP-N-acetylglucosamine acyltransferase